MHDWTRLIVLIEIALFLPIKFLIVVNISIPDGNIGVSLIA